MLRAIVGQQVSVRVPSPSWGAWWRAPRLSSAPRSCPPPTQLCELDLDGIGMPGSRIRTLQGLCLGARKRRTTLGSASDEQLLALPGIGPGLSLTGGCAAGSTRTPSRLDLVLQKALGR